MITSANATNYLPLKLVVLFFIALALLHWLGKLPLWVLAAYVGLSLITFISYAWDKRQAQAAGRRTPESTLHLMSLLGGWPGACLAQQHLRHKSQKTSFLRLFWCTLLLNLGLLLYLFKFFWW
ncbi:DUF1294 domain-containing protein [Arsukibacterium sp.]|uniref:DUF1294 domain-containing protein n=1 Tax=Arsukibacterium sp. TaxID=1977258 RepID=UPI002FD98CD1